MDSKAFIRIYSGFARPITDISQKDDKCKINQKMVSDVHISANLTEFNKDINDVLFSDMTTKNIN